MTDPISNLYHSDESDEQRQQWLDARAEYEQEVENDDTITCISCGKTFIPRIPGSIACPKCLHGLGRKNGRP